MTWPVSRRLTGHRKTAIPVIRSPRNRNLPRVYFTYSRRWRRFRRGGLSADDGAEYAGGVALYCQIRELNMEGDLKMQKISVLILAGLLSGFAISGVAQRNRSAGAAPKNIHIDLKAEKAGGEPKAFLSMVGNWSIVQDDGKNC